MFTGIVEATGTIVAIGEEGTNKLFTVSSPISGELKPDQSVSHDGVCLTVTASHAAQHHATAVEETLIRSTLGLKKVGDILNMERSMQLNARMDGHLVQGHVDTTAIVEAMKERDGSWLFDFRLSHKHRGLLVEKGSVAVNGVSLTVIKASPKKFSVAIIPYTFKHTSFGRLRTGDTVNIEFDIIGKYVKSNMQYR